MMDYLITGESMAYCGSWVDLPEPVSPVTIMKSLVEMD